MAADRGRGEDVEMEDLPGDIDYDLEYLVRNRGSGIGIHRQRLDEARFERQFLPARRTTLVSRLKKMVIPPEPVLSALKPPLNKKEWKQFVLVHLPILSWVWSYRPSFLFGDIIAGITVAIMHVPQGLAYALLANLPAVYGLYASFIPVLVYSLFGTSKHISVGTFAVVELMIGNAIDRVINNNSTMVCIDGTANITDEESIDALNVTFRGQNTTCGELKVDIAIAVACMSGIIMFAMGLFKLGFISIFLSEPLVSGYTTGAAVHVFTSQLRHITGFDPDVPRGYLIVPRTWIATFSQITKTNVATLIVSIISILALIGFKIANWFLRKVKVPVPTYSRREHMWRVKRMKWKIPLPSQLIVVIVATLVSYLAQLKTRYDVGIVDTIPRGAPRFTVPRGEYMGNTIQDSFVIAIVTFSVTVSLAQVFARQFDYQIHSNQEFIAYGLMNVIGSFFSSFTAAGSLSRSTIQANSGGKTQLVGFISSLLILIVLVALGSLFEPLPRAVLASIVWVALYGMFKQVVDVWRYFLLSIPDMLVWLVVFIATALLGVDLGLGVGVGFALLVIILRTILPTSSVLGQAKDTEIYRNMHNFTKIDQVPGVIIFRFQAPLCFINSRVFRKRLEMVTHLDEMRMGGRTEEGCVQKLFYKTCMKNWSRYDVARTGELGGHETPLEDGINQEGGSQTTSNVTRSPSFQEAVADDIVSVDHMSSGGLRNRRGRSRKQDIVPDPIHTVVLDCAPIGFMDAVGVKTLLQTVLDFDKCDIQVLLAAMTKGNRDILERSGFFEKCGKEWIFPSIQDAVHHAQHGCMLRPGSRDEAPTGNVRSVETSPDEGNRQETQEDVSSPDAANEEEHVDIHEPVDLSTSEQQ